MTRLRLVRASLVALIGLSSSMLADELPAPIRDALLRHNLPLASVSVVVREPGAAKPVVAYRADEPRNPASTMKLLTTFAALELLGPAHTWKTHAYVNGQLADGHLTGDLVLQGGGDPFLVTEAFWTMLRMVREKGVRDIGGDLLVDEGYFDLAPEAAGDFDGKPYRAYNASPSALLVNFRATRFVVFPELDTGRIRVFADPPGRSLKIDNRLRPLDGPCRNLHHAVTFDVRQADQTIVTFSGSYPRACGELTLTRSVVPQSRYLFGLFQSLWQSLGGTLAGDIRPAPVPPTARLLHTHESPTLAEIVRSINKFSNNVMSRQLLLTLGAELYGAPGTVEKGARALAEWAGAKGLAMPELVVENGSGRSRNARISADSLARLLENAYTGALRPEFMSSLPIAAMDGSLARRFHGEPLAGRTRVKTGLLDDVRALAGYVYAHSGRWYIAVLLHNHKNLGRDSGTEVQDAFLRWVHEQ